MRLSLAAFLSILIFFPMPVGSAQQPTSTPDINTTHGFLEVCETFDGPYPDAVASLDAGYCIGWVTGFTEGVKVAETAYDVVPGRVRFCWPDGSSIRQAIHVIRKFIADHPEMEHLPTTVIAFRALSEAFPCHK